MRKLIFTLFLVCAELMAQSGTISPTTTLAKETGNNTSAANIFQNQVNGNVGAGNVSKVPLRNLLYNGSHTKIYVHLMPWFGTYSHMNVGYNSATLTQATNQVADMMSRGIDGAILDWYGPKNTQVNQASLYVMQAAQAKGGAFTFAITEDVGALKVCAATAGCSLTAQVISDLTYVNNTFASASSYMRINGRPVIFFFGVEKYALDWNAIRAAVPGNPLFIFRNAGGFTKTQSNGGFGWVSIDTTNTNNIGIPYLDYFYSTALKYPVEHTYGTAYKGFNDVLAAWTANRIMNQNCGQTWLSTFAELSKYYSANNELANFQVATWNDYEEGTEIETGIDNCVSVRGSMSGKVLNWSITGQENTIDHYTVFISTDGQNLMPVADVPASGRSLDLSGYGFDTASYTLFVKAIGKPSMTNKMSGPIAWSQVNLSPVAQLSVTPNSGIAPVTVTADASASTETGGTVTSSSIDFGDGTVVSGFVGSHNYAAPGSYVVSVRVADKMGVTSTATKTVSIAANQKPVARLTVSPGTGVAPVTVTVDSTGSTDADGKIVSGTISFGDGTVVSGQSATHTFTTAGTYSIIATVTDDRGASGTAMSTFVVAAHAAPTVTLSVTPLTGTAPVNVTAFAWASSSSSTAPTIVINWGDGSAVSAANTATHTYSKAGNYTVTATATDSMGLKGTATAVVSVSKAKGSLSHRPGASALLSGSYFSRTDNLRMRLAR